MIFNCWGAILAVIGMTPLIATPIGVALIAVMTISHGIAISKKNFFDISTKFRLSVENNKLSSSKFHFFDFFLFFLFIF